MNLKKRYTKTVIFIFFIFCFSNTGFSQVSAGAHENIHKITTDSVIQTSSYTYVLANENNVKTWLAFPKKMIAENESYYYSGGYEMRDFKSKELNRTFKSILFLDGIVSPDDINGKNKEQKQEIKIEPLENGISISELFMNKGKYADKTIRIKGKVTKYNANIMQKNWIHLEDGSENSSKYDFTATSEMEAQVGEIITIEGKIVLNKDFGSGYKYELIMENGQISK